MSLIFDNPEYSGGQKILDTPNYEATHSFAATLGSAHVAILGKCAGAAVDAGGFLDGDSDPDGDALSYEIVDNVDNGTLVTYIGGAFTYTPNVGFIGKDRFSYLLWAGCESSGPYVVTIDVDGPYTGIAFTGYIGPSAINPQLVAGYEASISTDPIGIADIPVVVVSFDFSSFAGVAELSHISIAEIQNQIRLGFGGVVDMNSIDLTGVSGTISYGRNMVANLDNVALAHIAANAKYTAPMFEFVARVHIRTQVHRITLRAK